MLGDATEGEGERVKEGVGKRGGGRRFLLEAEPRLFCDAFHLERWPGLKIAASLPITK